MPKDFLEKIKEGRTFRDMHSILAIRKKDDGTEEDGIIEGYATVFNKAYQLGEFKWGDKKVRILEIVDKNAFDGCDMKDVILQYDHQGRVIARTNNNTLKLQCDSHGLNVVAKLNGTSYGRELLEEIRGGYSNKMSFGFIVQEDVRDEHEENDVVTITRTITKISKLFDVSVVSIPANDATEVSARSFGDGVIKELESERAKREQINILKRKINIYTM